MLVLHSWQVARGYGRLRRMATKPREVDWGGLIDLKQELFQWLVERKLISSQDRPLRAILKLRCRLDELEPVPSAVTEALYQIETFIAAGRRADKEEVLQGSGLDPETIKLLTDDSVERETDRSIRRLLSKFAHLERLFERIGSLQLARAKALGFAPDVERIERLQASAAALCKKCRRDGDDLHRALLCLAPSMDHEELTLSGCRQFEKRVRRELADAGYRLRS